MSILLTLIIIAVLVLVHEWGHFVAARRIGIPVHEFSLGFGYQLWSIKRDGVIFSIRLIPLGGFVRLSGEEVGDQEDPRGYAFRKPWEKMLVSFAGPFMNFVLAILIFIVSFAFIGIPNSTNDPVIGTVYSDKPAAISGMKAGDKVLRIDGQPVANWSDIEKNTRNSGKTVLEFEIERGAEKLMIVVTPAVIDSYGTTGIGVTNTVYHQRFGIIESIVIGFEQTFKLTVALLYSLGILATGGASMNDIAGPVGITRMVGDFAQLGLVTLLNFAAILSINLGIMNLLPIPALDGFRIVFASIEMIRRKPLNPEKEGMINWVGFLLLMTLMLVVTFNDIVRWVKG